MDNIMIFDIEISRYKCKCNVNINGVSYCSFRHSTTIFLHCKEILFILKRNMGPHKHPLSRQRMLE